MSSAASSKSVSFPEQRELIAYINRHPGKKLIDLPCYATHFPESTNKVSEYFASKKMDRNKIAENLKPIFEMYQVQGMEDANIENIVRIYAKVLTDLTNGLWYTVTFQRYTEQVHCT